MKAGDAYLMESFNEIEFTAPDHYFQKVISSNSTFPSQGNEISPMDFIQASFYQPVLAEIAISPLSPQAFSYYNFKYLGASLQGNYTINKIAVLPKRKSQQVFEGVIYIIEDLWCLQSVDLTNDNIAGKIKIRQLYIPVKNDIWMPVSHEFEINISLVGFKADAGYVSSVKYVEVRPNLALVKPKSISTDYKGRAQAEPDTAISRSKQQIEKILGKDQLSNRDMVKLSRLMQKESEKSIPDSSSRNPEIKDKTTRIIEKDASKKDSAYWAEIRPVPLSDVELKSIRKSDSIKTASSLKAVKSDTSASENKKQKSKFLTTAGQIVSGHTWSDTTGLSFLYGGLVHLKNISFNTVDGFVYGLDLRFSKSWKNNRSLSVSPDARWAFSRSRLLWRINSEYNFNGLKIRQLYLRIGISDNDINNAGGINTFLNSITTLFLKDNYLKLYESRYIGFGYRSEIINGLNLELRTKFESRGVLENTTSFSLSNSSKEYSGNIPVNSYLVPGSNPINVLRDQRHGESEVKLTYIPYQKYRINNGRKIPAGSDWPAFSLSWQHGINEFTDMQNSIKQYDMLKFEAYKTQSIGAFSEFRWRFRTGGYFDNRDLTFYDFFHFNSQPVPLLFNDYEDAFMIPAYYSMSTPEFFGELHMKYTTPYLLLKLLPLLSNTLMRENLSLSWLGSRYHSNYTEIGYSISEFLFVGEIGIYFGFDDIKYKSAGAKLVLKFK
jgi:hypothetical protein